jgi:predicted GTPase
MIRVQTINLNQKVTELFKAVKDDLENSFEDRNSIYSIPYKIGFTGEGNVGKTTLVLELANMKRFILD